jgi:cellulose synthase operon protein YhjQ
MGSQGTELDDQSTADGTPEDVAVLYSWANLQGAKYRDYSASRREYRAQVRYRAAKALLERELRAQAEAEKWVAEEERTAAAAGIAHSSSEKVEESQPERLMAPRASESEEMARKASTERVGAARRAEAAARAAVVALREEREMAEAHSSARRQAMVYEQAELRRRQLAGPQPQGLFGEAHSARETGPGDLRSDAPGNLQRFLFSSWQDFRGNPISTRSSPSAEDALQTELASVTLDETGDRDSDLETEEQYAPAWLFPALMPQHPPVLRSISPAHRGEGVGDTLQDSRERVAARWFALKGVFDNAGLELPAMQATRPRDAETPVLAVFSLAGGVGKTSLVATLGRALASQQEKVVLTDTTSQGLLPIYFGSHEIAPGVLHTFPAKPNSSDTLISMMIHELGGLGQDDRRGPLLAEDIVRSGEGSDRLLLDVSSSNGWVIQRLANLHPTVLVPMAPDMNSVISLQAVERLFRATVDREGPPLLPYYVLNQFDASLALHLDVREVLRRQLGDRLLRVAIRRSPAVSEALAEGMTVLDYAPDAPVSQDYRDIATWLRSVSPAAREGARSLRRVEQ